MNCTHATQNRNYVKPFYSNCVPIYPHTHTHFPLPSHTLLSHPPPLPTYTPSPHSRPTHTPAHTTHRRPPTATSPGTTVGDAPHTRREQRSPPLSPDLFERSLRSCRHQPGNHIHPETNILNQERPLANQTTTHSTEGRWLVIIRLTVPVWS